MTRNLKKLLSTVTMAGFLGSVGCLGGAPTTSSNPSNPSQPADPSNPTPAVPVANDPTDPANGSNTGGAPDQTFDHMNEDTDPFQVLARIQEQGPPEISTRMHSCAKMKYATLGNVLKNVGVTMTGTGATTPNGLYTTGAGALGKPDYANRLSEGTDLSTAGAVRLYDIFVAAGPQIITAMPMNARCMVAGAATQMFDATGCTMKGITCLTGAPATQAQKDLCDSAVASNTTDKVGTTATAPTVGQVIAVASLLAASHSCE